MRHALNEFFEGGEIHGIDWNPDLQTITQDKL
jgi:hypothetical protein